MLTIKQLNGQAKFCLVHQLIHSKFFTILFSFANAPLLGCLFYSVL